MPITEPVTTSRRRVKRNEKEKTIASNAASIKHAEMVKKQIDQMKDSFNKIIGENIKPDAPPSAPTINPRGRPRKEPETEPRGDRVHRSRSRKKDKEDEPTHAPPEHPKPQGSAKHY